MKAALTIAGKWLGSAMLYLCSFALHAESQVFGSYEVHYSLFPSTFLHTSIAASYGIEPAADRAVLNIALRRKLPDGNTQAVSAALTGVYGDLVAKAPLAFREVREEDTVYYLGELSFEDGVSYFFDITLMPVGDSGTLHLQFHQPLYVEATQGRP